MRVAVLGAGYAGLALARKLEDALPPEVDLVVVDEDGSHLVQHELHRVVRRPSLADEIVLDLEDVLDRASVRRARVTDVDPEAGVATLVDEVSGHEADADADTDTDADDDTDTDADDNTDADADDNTDADGTSTIEYDYAAVCLGADTNYYDLPGVEEHATPLKRLPHAERIREDFLDALDAGTPADPSRVVVGGAGLSGIQVAGELAALARERTEADARERRAEAETGDDTDEDPIRIEIGDGPGPADADETEPEPGETGTEAGETGTEVDATVGSVGESGDGGDESGDGGDESGDGGDESGDRGDESGDRGGESDGDAAAPVEVVLLEMEDAVAPRFPANFQRAVREELEKRDVRVRTSTAVASAGAEAIELESGERLACDQFVWTGGIRGPGALGGERPPVRNTLRLGDGTFVLGDAGKVVDTDGAAVPASAQAAVRQARVAAENIERLVAHEREGTGGFEPRLSGYRFDSPGWLVSVGDGAVAQVGPTVLTGYAAKALKTTVGAGYLSSVGAVQNAVDLVREELGWPDGDAESGNGESGDGSGGDDGEGVDVDVESPGPDSDDDRGE